MIPPNQPIKTGQNRWSFLAGCLGIVLFCQLPFSVALEIHHAFAAVDHDGHEHSDFDLCQWVQQHTSGSLVIDPPTLVTLAHPESHRPFYPEVFFSSLVDHAVGSRAPPALV